METTTAVVDEVVSYGAILTDINNNVQSLATVDLHLFIVASLLFGLLFAWCLWGFCNGKF
jgi:hypothetical protein